MKTMFIGFEGRINRAKWWLGNLLLGSFCLVVYYIMLSNTGMSSHDLARSPRFLSTYQLAVAVVTGYPITALAIKRLNDRERPRYLAFVFWALPVAFIVGGLFGFSTTAIESDETSTSSSVAIALILDVLSLGVSTWSLVELGLLKGTNGPNRHGLDPITTRRE